MLLSFTGLLVSEFLQGSGSGSLDYCHMIMKNEDDFEKFNLIVGDFKYGKIYLFCKAKAWMFSNISTLDAVDL